MGIAITLQKYLEQKGIHYTLKEHSYSEGSFNTARAADVDESALAKGVLLRDEDFTPWLCVLPAKHKILRHTLNQIFDRHLELVDEEELADIFSDCAPGAVPALGEPYGLNTLWDEALLGSPQVYIEAGDHKTLICLSQEAFQNLMADKMCERFSSERRRYRFRKHNQRKRGHTHEEEAWAGTY